MSIRRLGLGALLLAALHLIPIMAAAAGPPHKAEVDTRLLIGEVAQIGGGSTEAWAGLDVRLGSGWHTYWRSAGDAGAPPDFDWSGSRNVADVTIEWPAPRRFTEQDIDTFGYDEHVLFPLRVRLQDKTAPAHLALKAVLFVCSVICTQQEAQLAADIPASTRQPNDQAQIDAWRHLVPRETSPGLSITALRLDRQAKPQLLLDVQASPLLVAPDVFIDGHDAISGGRVRVNRRSDGGLRFTVPVLGLDQAGPIDRLRVTLVDGDRSIEATLPVSAADTAPATAPATAMPHAAAASIWTILGIALLGGFILNFMPCVFPVLSLKLVSLVDHAPDRSASPRSAFLATAAGIIASFVTLAVVLSAMKAAGAQVGWGLQFQQPVFLVAMIIVLAAFGANLLGLFEISLPWRIASWLGATTGDRTLASHLVNGFVMTLLATPCSAPFVGTAIAFALSQAAPQILLVFTGLGVGMAAPYLCLAAAPRFATLVPRPGRWMLKLRAVAAIAMAATAAWLLIVLSDISGPMPAIVLAAALLVAILIMTARRFPLRRAMVGAGLAVTIAVALMAATHVPQPPATAPSSGIVWQPLEPAEIAAQVRAGHTVFVDIGASWCVTCKVNEKLVLDSTAVRSRLSSGVVAIRADWTSPSDAIAAYLRSFGRYGLPFNAVFGPGAPDGILLPELLTPQIVLDAIDTASNPPHPENHKT
ncbi:MULTISPECIES: protein-disulfide reductase DsbD family protein [Bradyrhizobium]|jgi:suppressor for copper-sensitivity B|uniref:protein-disulfide reductase DsbD family protein n=4 Tax=Nitrobacteraceae TaxID=41294 RepID=UPI00039E5CE4|nr:protein-disulfide reductase DsbD domain-containing protein [Bradyrhizobium denitrificans]MCL8484300.1 thioredoxin family protein [Bradyrhizobium denitrificans]RTL96337.1 MAG: protein-disulfide reductase [Bradyrhizobiaceae bacterium]